MVKLVVDAGIAIFKGMLRYKCQQAGIYLVEINKTHTTWAALLRKVASIAAVLVLPELKALGMKTWSSGACNTMHDRDVSTASNILATWHCRLAVGILSL